MSETTNPAGRAYVFELTKLDAAFTAYCADNGIDDARRDSEYQRLVEFLTSPQARDHKLFIESPGVVRT